MTTPTHDVDEILLAFTRAVRAAGVNVTQDRAHTYLAAVAALDAANPELVQVAGRATLCANPDELARHDRVFEEFFLDRAGLPRTVEKPREQAHSLPANNTDSTADADPTEEEVIAVAASTTEVLRQRDIANLTPAEKALLARMFDALPVVLPQRRARRRTPWHRGQLDPRRTLRDSLRLLGEPGRIAWRDFASRPRRVVLLIDVSGSMSGYAEALLRLAHRFARAGRTVEVFTLGTRLSHLTKALQHHNVESAMAAVSGVVPDWSGGTRLGECLQVFLDRWGQAGTARGAVVVVFSDGWERGDAAQLGEQMQRLAALAHQVIWVNPHRGRAGYEPIQQGIVAALPHVDELLAGHSLATYHDLVIRVGQA